MKENDGTWCVDCGHPIAEHGDKGCTTDVNMPPEDVDRNVSGFFACFCLLTPQGVRDASDAAANEPWE